MCWHYPWQFVKYIRDYLLFQILFVEIVRIYFIYVNNYITSCLLFRTYQFISENLNRSRKSQFVLHCWIFTVKSWNKIFVPMYIKFCYRKITLLLFDLVPLLTIQYLLKKMSLYKNFRSPLWSWQIYSYFETMQIPPRF